MFWNLKFMFLLTLLFCMSVSAYAVEVAPRISDREIITSLTELRMGQKSLEKQFNQIQKTMEVRFNQIQKTSDERGMQINRRLGFLENLMLVIISSIVGLVAFIIWDRKTALRPLEQKLDRLEHDLQQDLELQSSDGSRLTRVIHALRELAQQDPKLKQLLHSFSLL